MCSLAFAGVRHTMARSILAGSAALNTVRDYLVRGENLFLEADLFFGHGTDNAWDEAVLLVCHCVGASPDADRSLLDRPVSTAEGAQIDALFRRRVEERIPAAYLIGEAWFCRLRFKIDRRVIIPRSPFAELIGEGFAPWLQRSPARILDLCCGSGCIGIAAALRFPGARVVLADLSGEALAVAAANVELHAVGDRVTLVQSDGFQALGGERFDLILCNPPYVDPGEYAALPPEYAHEPALALLSGSDGLEFTRMLLQRAADHLTGDGMLFAECGDAALRLAASFPHLPLHWLEFEAGGYGVYCLSRLELTAP